MGEHVVATTDDLEPGDRIIVELEGREVAVFNLDGEYYAYLNYCAHQGGPLCEGETVGKKEVDFDRETLEYSFEWTREGEIIACPWHNWEFDLLSGECISREGVRLPSYPVTVTDGEVVVRL